MEKLITPQELADMVGVPVGTVYRWNHVGSGPRPIPVGRHVRYRPQDVERWLEEQSRAS